MYLQNHNHKVDDASADDYFNYPTTCLVGNHTFSYSHVVTKTYPIVL